VTRLTDEELGHLESMCSTGNAPFARFSVNAVEQAALELRERRRADLSGEERELLTWLVAGLRDDVANEDERLVDGRTHKALAVLDKLLGGAK
jgi:hypothetical protein